MASLILITLATTDTAAKGHLGEPRFQRARARCAAKAYFCKEKQIVAIGSLHRVLLTLNGGFPKLGVPSIFEASP